MPLNASPRSLQKDLVIQELEDEILIYDLRKHKAFCLNRTAAFVWRHADGETPVEQIARLLQRKLRTPVDESVGWFALEQLAKNELLESKTPAPTTFAGMTRRQLITTLGKLAAVAIPLVFAITAPVPAAAQSTCRQPGRLAAAVLAPAVREEAARAVTAVTITGNLVRAILNAVQAIASAVQFALLAAAAAFFMIRRLRLPTVER